MGLLSGKWCVITGAGRGIGEAIAVAFSGEGASLALVARSKLQLEEVAEACRRSGAEAVEVYLADLSDSAAVAALAKQLLAAHATIDVLVNNAGRTTTLPDNPLEGDVDDWDGMLALNLSAPMRLTHAFAPTMVKKGGGVIINMGSLAAVVPVPMLSAYSATKYGLRGWSLNCFETLRKYNIKVVLINPAVVKTSMSADFGVSTPELMITPKDIAEACMLAIRTSPSACPQEITIREVVPLVM